MNFTSFYFSFHVFSTLLHYKQTGAKPPASPFPSLLLDHYLLNYFSAYTVHNKQNENDSEEFSKNVPLVK